ncbi:MAG: uroporphyrinogen decarboxylase [Acidimicrobiales bacterium]|nr:uroporphyrinogen decarboxylase [Acidimicrobiales bacterium]
MSTNARITCHGLLSRWFPAAGRLCDHGSAVPEGPEDRVLGVSVSPTSPFLRACRKKPVDRRPVWFMRQAGRSLPEYRRLRGEGSILDAIRQPDLATELTLQPVRRYGVDAAILYSDIMVPVEAIGFGVDIVPGIGPVVDTPFAGVGDLERLRPLDPEADTGYVLETVRNLVAELDVPLIGFAGAPFTVASYLVEGKPSRSHQRTKALMYTEPDLWHRLMDRLTDLALVSLQSQIDAGASAIQVFDSWVGTLSPVAYRDFVAPHVRRLLTELAGSGVPRILFGVDTGELLASFVDVGADVVGVDWRVPLDVAVERTGGGVALQGNLDPSICLAPWPVVEAEVRDVLTRGSRSPGHIFNLGHGVVPEIDPSILELVVALVHDEPV